MRKERHEIYSDPLYISHLPGGGNDHADHADHADHTDHTDHADQTYALAKQKWTHACENPIVETRPQTWSGGVMAMPAIIQKSLVVVLFSKTKTAYVSDEEDSSKSSCHITGIHNKPTHTKHDLNE